MGTNETKTRAHAERAPKKKEDGRISTVIKAGASTIIIVLVMYAMLMVPTGQNPSVSVDFGSYGSRRILFENDSPLYRAIISAYQQVMGDRAFKQAMTAQEQMSFRYYAEQAFREVAFQVALLEEASRAGAFVSDGFLGKTLSERLAKLDGPAKISLVSAARDQYAQYLFASAFEFASTDRMNEFVGSLAREQRVIEFVTFGSDQYPDSEAIAFAEANPDKFRKVRVSMFAAKSRELADSKLAEIESGALSFVEAVRGFSSDPATQASGGYIPGIVCAFQVKDAVGSDEIANAVLALSPGKRTKVFESPVNRGTFVFYQLDQAPTDPDYSDPEIAGIAKRYVIEREAGRVETWLSARAASFHERALVDFDLACAEFGVSKKESSAFSAGVGNLSVNITYPGYPQSFPMSLMTVLNDPNDRYEGSAYAPELEGASADPELVYSAFSTPVGGVAAPRAVFSAYTQGPATYIVFRVKEASRLDDSRMPSIYSTFGRMVADLTEKEFNAALLEGPSFRDSFDSGFKEILKYFP